MLAELARNYNLSFYEDSRARSLNNEDSLLVVKGKDRQKLIWEQRLETLSIYIPRIIMISIILTMLAGSLVMKATLTETTARVQSAQNELSDAVNVNNFLNNEYNQLMNFAQIEEAAQRLGLQKATSDQIRYIDNLHTENAIIYSYKTPLQELGEKLTSGINSLCDKYGFEPIFN